MTRREFFQRRIPRYRKDPLLFFKEVTHFEPDPWQREAAVAVSQHRRVAIRSGQGVGKTALEANLMWWFIACFSYPRIVCTAPTMQQLDNVLWAEMAKWLDASPVLQMMFTWTKTRVYMNGYDRRWFAVPRTATKPESLQGFHEDNMFFVVDEASGVADPILDAIGGTLTGANNRLLYCGNPTKATGGFAESFQGDGMDWYCMTVSSRDSPRTSKENIAALEKKYGKNSNVVRVRVDGLPPVADSDVFIPSYIAEKATMNEPLPHDSPVRLSIGCDVALTGANNRLLYCGNPTKATGGFAESFQGDGMDWYCMTVSSRDSPRTSKENIAALEKKYGKNSNVVRVRVDGLPPVADSDVFIPSYIAEKATMNEPLPHDSPVRLSIGCDVARFGDDCTVIAPNIDADVQELKIRNGQDLWATAEDIIFEYLFLLEKYPQYPGMVYAIIDDTGLGGGVTDILRHEREARGLNQLEVIPVNFGASVPQEDAAANYADISTWMWSLVRDMAQSGRLHLPNDTELIAQLSTRKYAFAGTPPKLKLESKDIMKRRGLPSPDRADAVALSLYQPVTYTWEIG